jgi:hypothetical protein
VEDYVKLAVFKQRRLAFTAYRVLKEHGVAEVNVWPVNFWANAYLDDSHVLMVAQTSFSRARQLLVESGLLANSDVLADSDP